MSLRTSPPLLAGGLAVLGSLAVTGCGGSKPTPAQSTPAPPASIHATLAGESHHPVAGRRWHYRVTVTDAAGKPLTGTETTHYTFGGAVVGTEHPENVNFSRGVYNDTIEFPPAAVGHPLELEVVVHTDAGSATVSWPIEVLK